MMTRKNKTAADKGKSNWQHENTTAENNKIHEMTRDINNNESSPDADKRCKSSGRIVW